MQTKTVAGRTWHFSHSIGHLLGEEGFTWPTPVLSAGNGIVYVGETGGAEGYGIPRINKYSLDEDKMLAEIGARELNWPEGLALDSEGNIYCSQARDHLVSVYNQDGEKTAEWGEVGSGEGQFRGPSGLAFDSDENLLVVDSLNSRIQTYTKDGRYLSTWGTPGSDPGQLDRPWGIAIDGEGDIYVADWGNDRVQKFSQGGTLLGRFGSEIDDGGQLKRPADVAIDSQGDVYVADWGNNRVQIYYPDGDIITGLYGDAREFSRAAEEYMAPNADQMKAFNRVDPVELVEVGRLDRPRGIAIDEQDRIIITDGKCGRLQVYCKDKDYVVPQFNL